MSFGYSSILFWQDGFCLMHGCFNWLAYLPSHFRYRMDFPRCQLPLIGKFNSMVFSRYLFTNNTNSRTTIYGYYFLHIFYCFFLKNKIKACPAFNYINMAVILQDSATSGQSAEIAFRPLRRKLKSAKIHPKNLLKHGLAAFWELYPWRQTNIQRIFMQPRQILRHNGGI